MKKRGIESLISWILIIGFTIALGTFIMIWAINLSKNVDPGKGQEESTYCGDVQITINDTICIDNSNTEKNIKISVLNKGPFTIWNLTIGREAYSQLQSCIIKNDASNNFLTIKPQDARYILVNSIQPFEDDSFGILEQCPTFIGPGNELSDLSQFSLNSISIIPWIKTESGYVACQSKKIVITNKLPQYSPALVNLDPECV